MHRRLWRCYVEQCRIRGRRKMSEAGRRGNWRRWHREREITSLMPMVEKLAKQIRRMFAPHLDIRDLIQSGYLGLCKAAECYSPARGPFDRYAWFRVRGAIIDSQKRRAYREEQNISLDMISEEHSGELPGRVDLDPAPRPDEVMMAAEREQAMKAAMRRLRREERRVLRSHLEGESLTATARATGIPAGLVKVRLAEAQARMTLTMRAGV